MNLSPCPIQRDLPSAYTPYDLHETFSHRSHLVPIFFVSNHVLYILLTPLFD